MSDKAVGTLIWQLIFSCHYFINLAKLFQYIPPPPLQHCILALKGGGGDGQGVGGVWEERGERREGRKQGSQGVGSTREIDKNFATLHVITQPRHLEGQ